MNFEESDNHITTRDSKNTLSTTGTTNTMSTIDNGKSYRTTSSMSDPTTITETKHTSQPIIELGWKVQQKDVWFPFAWENTPIEVKTISNVGSNDQIFFEVAEHTGNSFARVVVRMSQTPIYFVRWCQIDTPLTNLPPASDDTRIWKFIKHGFEGISIECNGVEVAHLKFAESLKPECQSSQWISSTVEFIKFNLDWDKTVAIRGTFFANVSFSF